MKFENICLFGTQNVILFWLVRSALFKKPRSYDVKNKYSKEHYEFIHWDFLENMISFGKILAHQNLIMGFLFSEILNHVKQSKVSFANSEEIQ